LAKKQDKKWEEGNTQNKGCLLCHLQTWIAQKTTTEPELSFAADLDRKGPDRRFIYV
jgi:hypothetical protein